MLVIVDGREC